MKCERWNGKNKWSMWAVVFLLTGLAAHAELGDGIKLDKWTLDPYIDLQTVYDSNVDRIEDGTNDLKIVVKPGLLFRFESADLNIEGDIWGRLAKYTDMSNRNHNDFGERLAATAWDRDSIQIRAEESFYNVEDYDVSTARIEARRLLGFQLSAARDLTDKVGLDGGCIFDGTDYQSPSLYDWKQTTVWLEGANKITDKTFALLKVNAGSQTSDGSSGGTFESVLLGARNDLTEKVSGKALIGLYQHDSDYGSIRMVGYDASLRWKATPKLSVDLLARNTVEPGTQDAATYRIVTQAEIGGTWRFTDRYSSTLTGGWTQNDYQSKVDGQDKADDNLLVIIRGQYTHPARWLTAYIEGRQEDKNATTAGFDYTEYSVLAGVTLFY